MTTAPIAGRYQLESLLRRSAMAEVWRARDLELDRRIALKLLAPDADRARFDREARAVAALSHPNVTRLFDYGEADGRPFMALEYLAGGTLEDRLADEKPLPDEETEAIARGVAAALAHAHAQGVVHRDLKPANILFDDEGRPKLTDFGIARLGGSVTLTEEGTIMGTAGYISPEQARGDQAGPASDVFSFGVVLYRMLTGRLPFEARSPLQLVELHRQVDPPAIDVLRPGAPAKLARIARAALSKDPRLRPPDGAALAAELGGDGGEAMTPAAAPTAVLRRRLRSRTPIPLALLLAALAVLGAAGILAAVLATRSGSGRHTRTPPSTAPSTASPLSVTTPSTQTTATTNTTLTATTAPTTSVTQPATTTTQTTSPTTTAPTTTPPTTTAPAAGG